MIEEQGVVVRAGAGKALVRTERSGACEGCAARGACAHLGGSREAQVWADDPLGVRPGERVVIAVPEGTVLRAGFLVYLLPVAALVAGAVAGNALGPRLGLTADLGAALCGVAAMAATFLGVRRFGGKGVSGPRIARRA
ncbi:MAG: hypothetical protein Kow0092_34120 [Deferrisomatales bacterium]